jgi:hypothetical protein
MAGFEIDPNRWYTEEELRQHGAGAGGPFTTGALRRARQRGLLRASETERGKRTYRGRDLVAWLEGLARGATVCL